jgi:uncharacterized protein (UPF0333 family)
MFDLITGLGGQLIGGLVVIIGLVAAYFGVKRSGAKQAVTEKALADAQAREKAVIEADNARKSAAGATDDQLDQRMRRWER